MDDFMSASELDDLINTDDYPCASSQYCGNSGTTVRNNGVRNVRLCESCAAEHDEGGE